jgi:hypothetical protein
MAQKTIKKRPFSIGPKACHPKIKSRNGECLPSKELDTLGDKLGAPSSLKGQGLKRWITRRTKCKSERCWVEKADYDRKKKGKILKEYFRPTMPDSWEERPAEWLDSLNIADVMKQYEEAYPNFKFIGTNPIDFSAPNPYKKDSLENGECLQEEICKMNLKELAAKGITSIGLVYNLDPSDKPGSHWIASFTDIPGHKSYYFDSYGYKTPPQIARFMRSLTLQDPKMTLEYCARRFQYGQSECGMYCIYFILRMLSGDNFKKFCRNPPSDNDMTEFRKTLFAQKN